MTIVKRFLFCTAASVVMLAGAHAADLPVKAGKIEYVKVCSLYGAGFYYIPGTDTCVRIGGAMNILTTFNGNPFDGPMWQGGPGGANSYNRNYFQTLERFYLNIDTRTQTEYGVLRTYANLLFDFIPGRENIAGGIIENDFLFLQFAGFTFGKAVSMFDPQWAVSKPTISAGFFAGSNNVTGLPMLAYTATFGNGLDATISLEDAQPYRSAGVVDTSQQFLGPFGAAVTNFGTTSNTFLGNAQAGDHVPDVVANLRYDQAWGTLHFGAAAHEVHGTYYNRLGKRNSGRGSCSMPGKQGHGVRERAPSSRHKAQRHWRCPASIASQDADGAIEQVLVLQQELRAGRITGHGRGRARERAVEILIEPRVQKLSRERQVIDRSPRRSGAGLKSAECEASRRVRQAGAEPAGVGCREQHRVARRSV